ncbi:MAG: hypothetical protein GXY53_05625, partial [Desulfobulbus sp.]|nr:hypothetical protein [Desulfobulbus sp.]
MSNEAARMSKGKKEHRLVPRLRFREFRKAKGWETSSLGAIVTLEYGSALPEKNRTGNGFPVVGSNGIVGYHKTATVVGPAIVIGRKGSFGQINLINYDCTPIDTTFYVVPKRPEQDNFYFIWRLLEVARLDRLGDVGAIPGLNRNDVYAQKTAIPTYSEQQKIADCLSSLDELITAETKKLTTLKTYKKGLMQQLFPREGETVPRLRFREFRKAGEWEIKTLAGLCEMQAGKFVAAKVISDQPAVD